MSLKIATLLTIIGQIITLMWILTLNLELIQWNRIIGIVINIIGSGSLILFFVVLYRKQIKLEE